MVPDYLSTALRQWLGKAKQRKIRISRSKDFEICNSNQECTSSWFLDLFSYFPLPIHDTNLVIAAL